MRYLVLLALLAAPLFSSASGMDDDLNASELREIVADASRVSESYHFSMDMDQSVEVSNLTSGEVQTIHTRSIGIGAMNTTSRSLRVAMASLTLEEGDWENATASAVEEYILNDTLYLRFDGNWTSMRLPDISGAWSDQDTLAKQADMLNRSNLSFIGFESVDGEECYRLLALMNGTEVSEQISGKAGSLLELTNVSDLFRNMTIEAYYWIDRETHQLRKASVTESFVLDPASFGLSGNRTEDMQMRVNATVTLSFWGHNESVKITLPEEALSARQLPEFASAQLPPDSSGPASP